MCMTTKRYRNSIFVHSCILLHYMTAYNISSVSVQIMISALALCSCQHSVSSVLTCNTHAPLVYVYVALYDKEPQHLLSS